MLGNNSPSPLHDNEIAATSHKDDGIEESSNISNQILCEECIEDSSHKGSDFVLQTLKDVKKLQGTLQTNREAKWLIA